ncbi:hypothetical protein [Paenibacillus aceti]|uniref:Uncharacterized protein n=1 Tax=Paenibacillus aceti TaxID=1820010 RepID=A0ABQ1VVJ6_9BACL|nr:hypothetical protein [Paenibacillus aceti]GGF98042.1 hypothetical protein GCM10010913_19730 [Paenibacillus aceti]
MLSIVVILVVTSYIIWFVAPDLFKNKYYKELWAFFILLSIGVAASLTVNLLHDVPTPLQVITNILSPLILLLKNIGLV